MAEQFKQQAWSLSDLFPSLDAPEVAQAMQELEDMVVAFEGRRDELSPTISTEKMIEIIKQYEQIVLAMMRLFGFGHLSFAADTQDQKIQTFLGQVQQLAAQIDNRTMFFKLWWKSLEDDVAATLMKGTGDYAYWFEALRLQKPYTLSEAEERVINIKDVNGPVALTNLYTAITNRYTYNVEVDGEMKELTRGELQVYYRSTDPSLRESAYKELYRVYSDDEPILGQIYQYLVRDWGAENVDLRGLPTPISARNLSNNVPDDVVEALLDACRDNRALFQRFFRLKAKWLGVDKLRRYDLYAPVVETDKSYSFGEGVDLILESFEGFDKRFSDGARKVMREEHLDSEVRKGKRSGAFCATLSPQLTPWVHVSYQGTPDDVATLAHEFGHAIHSLLSDNHVGLVHDASLPLAENASTFAEMLVVDQLLEKDPDPEVQRDLLFRQMDDSYATIMRQAYFALFEREAHAKIASGASVDELSDLYMENLKDQFGDSVDISEDFRYEWLVVPHIYHTPFYVYAYAFGQLLVLSLYNRYREQGANFIPGYIEILAAGGSDAPVRILEKAGIDVHSSEFWQGGFDVVKDLLTRLEALDISAM